jgi:hypothetical protein
MISQVCAKSRVQLSGALPVNTFVLLDDCVFLISQRAAKS